jgi:hypothetical protein
MNPIERIFNVLKKRMSETEIRSIAESNQETFESKLLLNYIGNDQKALSIFFKLDAVLTIEEFYEVRRQLITLEDSQSAFKEALKKGILSTDPNAVNFVEDHMYMQTINGKHQFKSITTREYIGMI